MLYNAPERLLELLELNWKKKGIIENLFDFNLKNNLLD